VGEKREGSRRKGGRTQEKRFTSSALGESGQAGRNNALLGSDDRGEIRSWNVLSCLPVPECRGQRGLDRLRRVSS